MNKNEFLPEAVEKISQLNFSGNIIPNSWFQYVIKTTDSGKKKADLLAINILAEICYWYRRVEVRDENTGKTIGYTKKFKADKLQFYYSALSEKFGQGKIAVKRACDLLVNLNLIIREFRNFTLDNGAKMTGVPYFEPVASSIKKITQTPLQKSKGVLPFLSTPPSKKVNHTKTTTETTIELTPPAKQELTPPSEEKTPLRAINDKISNLPKNQRNAQKEWFMVSDKMEYQFHDPKHVKLLNRPDKQLTRLIPGILEDDAKRETLQADIDIFFRFARKKISEALIKKLKNLDYILDKFDRRQYMKGFELAQAKGKGEENKLSYLRNILTKAFMPKVYSQMKSET